MPTFARGAKPTPRHKLLAAVPFRALVAPPPQFAVVPKKLSYWDNERDGVCVSSEEAFAKAVWSVYCGLPEVFASEQEVRDFAARHGWLDGADLAEVMDAMIAEGMVIGGQTYKDGAYNGVDYSNEATLQGALCVGPVKIAIDANALPPGAGNDQGWYAASGGRYPNTDHCVGLCGYGPAEFLYSQLGVPMPPALAGKSGYLLFTWSTIGFVTHAWLMGTCTEAWVRSPTTPGQSPAPPPVPPPGPTPPGPAVAYVLDGRLYVFGFPTPITVAGNISTPKAGWTPPAGWWQTTKDALKVAEDVAAKDWNALTADGVVLLRDLGVSL